MLRCHWRTRQRRRLSSHHPKEHLRRSGRQPAVSGKCRHVGAVVPPLEPPVLHEMSKSPHQYCAWQCEREPEASGPSASRAAVVQHRSSTTPLLSATLCPKVVCFTRAHWVLSRARDMGHRNTYCRDEPPRLETREHRFRSPGPEDSSHAIEQIKFKVMYAKMLYWNPC